jgi:hypothetical protein
VIKALNHDPMLVAPVVDNQGQFLLKLTRIGTVEAVADRLGPVRAQTSPSSLTVQGMTLRLKEWAAATMSMDKDVKWGDQIALLGMGVDGVITDRPDLVLGEGGWLISCKPDE